jgi:hypothetical protein
MFRFSKILLLAGMALPVLGQANGEESPVSMVNKKLERLNEREFFLVTLRNNSEKAVIGFVVRFHLLDGHAAPFSSVVMAGLTYDPNVERKKPGETWTMLVEARTDDLPSRLADDVRPQVDFVLFADMSSSGANKEGRANLLRAEYEGARGERLRLKGILKSQGVPGLVEALSKEEWSRGRIN